MGIMQLKSSGAAKQAPAKKVKKISFKENKQEKPAVDTEKIKANAELFNDLMTKAIEMRKFKPGDERLEAFSLKCEEYAKENNNAIPGSDFVVAALKEVGADEIAKAFEKALAGIDLDIAVSEIPDIEEPDNEDSSTDADSSEAPVDEEPTGDKEPETEEEPAEDAEPKDEATAVVDATPETETPAEQEAAPRRAGRPRKNA